MAPKKVEEKKRKAEEDAPTPKKEAKKDEAAPKGKAEPKKDAAPKAKADLEALEGVEKEKDAPADSRKKIDVDVGFNAVDTTLNVMPTVGGKVLMALSEGGMQYLIAGARANVGVKAGRYYYEVKIIEALNPSESSAGAKGRVPMPRQLVRLGFSVAGSPLVLGDSTDSIAFDSEAFYLADGKKTAAAQRFTRDQVIGVLLNLDPKSPNANTLSLFREGDRISEPQPLPEHLHGQTLFPHISFRSVTVQMLFGPEPLKPLPFKVRMLRGAAQADIVEAKAQMPKDGKCEVMVPVGFPDEGTFEWLDMFLAKNPDYVELSDRKILDWACSSGLWKPKAGGWKASNDKPEFNFGLPGMDDFSIRRVINQVAPLVPRSYVIMEVKSNLVEAERAEVLKRFGAQHFTRVAHIVMGEPNEDFKEMQREKLLKEKQEKADVEWKAKKAERERKKQAELRQKQLQEMRKKAEEARKKAAEEAKKKAEEAKRKADEAKKKAEEAKKKAEEEKKAKEEGAAEAEAKDEPMEEAKEEPKEEVKEEEHMEVDAVKEEPGEEAKEAPKEEKEEGEEKKEEEEEEEAEDEGPQPVELTEEEKNTWFPKASGSTDLTSTVLSQSFAAFTVPSEDEGFDKFRYEWQDAPTAKAYLQKWVLERKVTSRIEDLVPSQWFKDRLAEWEKLFKEWQTKQKVAKSEAAVKAAKEKKEAAEKREGEEDDKKDEDEEDEDKYIDIFAVENVCDVGNAEPLFINFQFEDWSMLQLRFELSILALAFKKDVDDPERIGIHETHLAFYYNKYHRKQLNPKYYGLNTNVELVTLVKDAVKMDPEKQVLISLLEEDVTEKLDYFVKLQEENRRERQRRVDAGDETAKLKFSPLAMQQASKMAPAAPAAKASWQPAKPAGAQWTQGSAARPQWQQPSYAGRPGYGQKGW